MLALFQQFLEKRGVRDIATTPSPGAAVPVQVLCEEDHTPARCTSFLPAFGGRGEGNFRGGNIPVPSLAEQLELEKLRKKNAKKERKREKKREKHEREMMRMKAETRRLGFLAERTKLMSVMESTLPMPPSFFSSVTSPRTN